MTNLLRNLRIVRKISIEQTALEAGITYRALSNIEREITRTPSRDVLLKILDALEHVSPVSEKERREVLEAYGYKNATQLPSPDEIRLAQQQCRASLESLPYPAMLMDFSTRLLDWNKFTPRLLGMPHVPIQSTEYFQLNLLKAVFVPPINSFIENHTEYTRDMVRVIKRELIAHRMEPWYREHIDALVKSTPALHKVWNLVPDQETQQTDLPGITAPVSLKVPGLSQPMRFQLVRIPFARDTRFLILLALPLDVPSIKTCLEWVSSNGDKPA